MSSSQGINIRDALAILAERKGHQHEEHKHNDGDGVACCHRPGQEQAVPEQLRKMGQTIHLDSQDGPDPKEEKSSSEQNAAKVAAEAEARKKSILAELERMSVYRLLKAVFEAQQHRVTTYKEYDSALNDVLNTGNVTNYPDACSKATASFSFSSDTIQSIRSILEGRGRTSEIRFLSQLQKHEQQKLHLTAALHLERIREKNHASPADDAPVSNPRIQGLLRESVGSLRTKIDECVGEINEVLEELRELMLEETEHDS